VITRTFLSLRRYRNYRYFFVGQVISQTGSWMQRIAQAWLIVQLTHSPVAVGVLAVAQFLPFTILGLFAGTLVDRFDARRAVIGTQIGQMVLASVLAALALAGVVQPWQVYVLAALNGCVMVLDAPARQALTYRMVGPAELQNAVALNSSLFNAARVFGPAVGGLIIAAVGLGWCFAINAASFLAVLASLLAMHVADFYPLERRERPAIWRGTREGLAYARHNPNVLITLLLVLVLGTLGFNFNVTLPILADETLHAGPRTFGVLSALFGAGALVGALLAAAQHRPSLRKFLIGGFVFSAAEILLAPANTTAFVALLLFVTGVGFTLWTANSNSMLQLEAPDHLRGRVVGLYFYAFLGTGPFGGLLAGWLCDVGGTELAFFVTGFACLAAVALGAMRLRPPRPVPERLETAEHARAV
jgi:MFS family permease